MSQPNPSGVASTLLAHRNAFKAFLTSRVGNEADAEDLLQNGLVKALQRSGEIKDSEKAVAWFYQVLRNVVVDHVRSRNAAHRRDEAWMTDTVTLADDTEAERHICACFEKILPGMKTNHAELLRRVELNGESVASAAASLGITANNASVTLHRARAELRTKLTDFCGDCACLDDCGCE
jgi:RNA polymerase sigma-70 factor (ECF subfamily)